MSMEEPSGTKSILVVDDDQGIVNTIKEDLESEGYRVHVGFDGQMAVALARRVKPDLIILDIDMPITSGIKALEYLRKFPETQTIPVIFLTGLDSANVYPVLDTSPRVAHLKKPLDLEHLNEMVRHCLQQYPVI